MLEWLRSSGWRCLGAPLIMGIFFGIGHFIAYYFFSMKRFALWEAKLNSFFDDYLR